MDQNQNIRSVSSTQIINTKYYTSYYVREPH